MTKKQISPLREKTVPELKSSLKEARNDLAKLRLESTIKKIKNVHQVFSQRKRIARILTLIREKELLNV